jgi:DNA-binding GntR family transcriptional regulator
VYKLILNRLISNEIPQGSKINQRRLSEDLKVSRTPLVKALHKLETQGFVDSVHDKGFYVHKLTIKDLLDLFIIRESLDAIVISELSDTIKPEQIADLEAMFEGFDERELTITSEAYWKADSKFHKLLFSFCQNDLVKKINDNFQILNRSLIAGLLRSPVETLAEHRDIIEALKSRNREAARVAAISHVERTRVFLEEAVQRLRQLGIDPRKITMEELPKR